MTEYDFEKNISKNKYQGSCVKATCPNRAGCPLFNGQCEDFCAILQTLKSYEIGLDEGRKPLKSTALIIAQTQGSFFGYHLVFYKKFKALQNMIMYKGQVFVDKKCDGEQATSSLPELQGQNLSNSICFKAFLRQGAKDVNTKWTPLVVAENAKGNQYINYSIIYKQSNGINISITSSSEVELIYFYSIPYQLFGSYLNRTLSYFYEDTDISFFSDMSKSKLSPEKIDFFDLRIITLSDGGTKSLSTATGINEINIDKKSIWLNICNLLNATMQSKVITELQDRIKTQLQFGKTFKLTNTTKQTMRDKKSKNIELSWNSSVLFPGDKPTKGNISSTITNK